MARHFHFRYYYDTENDKVFMFKLLTDTPGRTVEDRHMIKILSVSSDNCYVNMNPTGSILFNKYGMTKECKNWREIASQKKMDYTTGKSESAFYKVIRPIIYCLRMIGGFPYFEHKGSPRFKLFSCWSLYSIIFMTVEITLLHLRTLKILLNNDGNIFDVRLRSQINAFITTFQAFGPITLWFEVAGIVKFFSKWNTFQEDLNTYSIVLDTSLRKWIYGLMLTSFIYVLSMSYFEAKIYGGIVHIPAVIVVHANISLTLSLVVFSGLFSQTAATYLIKRIKNSRRTHDIVVYRKLWTKLAHLTTEIGYVLGPTMMEWLLLGSTVVIISCYSLIYHLHDIAAKKTVDQSEVNSGVFFLVISSTLLIFLCEFGHRCTASVGTKVQTELIRLSFAGRDKEFQQEVNLFIETIHVRFPNFVLCGFITLNRQYLVSLISGGLTYLIVLVQFRSNQNT